MLPTGKQLSTLAGHSGPVLSELVESQGTDILQRFYEDSFAVFPDPQREVVREYVEYRMVTVGGHRNPVARVKICDEIEKSDRFAKT